MKLSYVPTSETSQSMAYFQTTLRIRLGPNLYLWIKFQLRQLENAMPVDCILEQTFGMIDRFGSISKSEASYSCNVWSSLMVQMPWLWNNDIFVRYPSICPTRSQSCHENMQIDLFQIMVARLSSTSTSLQVRRNQSSV